MKRWEDHKVDVPEGESGAWKVERFTVSEEDAKLTNMRAAMKGRGFVQAGKYTQLTRFGAVIMSDTRDEIWDHFDPIRRARGNVLINGLGLGMVLQACAVKEEVERVIVVEKSADVIALVGGHYEKRFGDKIEIVEACAFEYKPPSGIRFGVVWHDIWDNITEDNLEEMKTLTRRYGRRADWQGSWARGIIERQRQRSKREERYRVNFFS